MYCTRKVQDDLIWVGADDRRLPFFEGVYGVPDGVSYNSYLLLDEKTVLFDTVDKAVYGVFLENLAHELGGRKLDYVVVHHMEPDHAATLELVLTRYPEATVICNAKIQTMIQQYFPLDLTGRVMLVKEGDTFSSGRHSFTFVMAPMVHWPEVMMTYDLTDKILFTADAFGSFGALNGRLFNDEVDFFGECLDEARRYYTNIVGKYGPQVQAVLKKAAKLDIALVCPLHGFVWRSHFGDFVEKYLQWSSYVPEEKSVMLAYASVYGHTENAANIISYAMGIHPSLIGAVPGKNSGSQSGTDKRELFIMKQALMKPMKDRCLRPLRLMMRVNGYDKDLDVVLPEFLFTTLDQAKSGKEAVIAK